MTFTIPFEMIEFSHHNKYEKALQIYLYLKSISNGIINEKNIDFEDVKVKIKVNTKRTFTKHLNKLLELNWIGYNKTTKNYFIRSFMKIRKMNEFNKRSGIVFEHKNFQKLKSFIPSAIICHDINKQEYAYKKKFIKRMGKAALKKGGALQANRSFLEFPPYFGKSNLGLGKLLGCGKSQANRVKIKARRNGFLSTKKHYEVITELNSYDGLLKNNFPDSNKIYFKTIRKKKTIVIQVRKQLHDEIKPKLRFKRLKRI